MFSARGRIILAGVIVLVAVGQHYLFSGEKQWYTQHEPMLARQKKEFAPYFLQGNMCCLKFQNEQFVLGILLSLFRTVEAKSPSHLTVKLMILALFKGIFYFLPW